MEVIIQPLRMIMILIIICPTHLFSEAYLGYARSAEVVRMSEEGAFARDLYLMIGLYRHLNDDEIPSDFSDLRELGEEYDEQLGQDVEEQYLIIREHDAIESLPDWRLILINKYPLPLSGASQREKRYLVYVNDSNELRFLSEDEEWFEKWIGDAIPGINFGSEQTEDIEEAAAQEPDVSPEEPAAPNSQEGAAEESRAHPPAAIADDTSIDEETAPNEFPNWLLWTGGLLLVAFFLIALTRGRRPSHDEGEA